jgi:hypothetical protein
MPHNDQTQDPALQIVTLAELKQQMRVEEDDEDTLITQYGRAAERQIIGDTRRSVNELCVMGYLEYNGVTSVPEGITPGLEWFPSPLKVAILMFAAQLYRNREPVAAGVSVAVIPYTLEVMVKPYVKLAE